ncbi:hypothetical protein [Pseudomonas moraviensis]
MFQQLAALIEPRLGRGVGVDENIHVGPAIFLDGDHPQLRIEERLPMAAALIPAAQRLTGQPGQGQAPAGVDAVGFQGFAVQ